MAKTFTRKDVIQMMRTRQGQRSNAALARELGITRAYVGDIYKERRDPGPKVLRALGGLVASKKVEVVYRRAS